MEFTERVLNGPALECAPLLLGATIERDDPQQPGQRIRLRITEVEAYHGAGTPGAVDDCSHARMGMTARNASMWSTGGHWYVYLNYGMHHALNLVCSPEGTASGVLIRAASVQDGIEAVRARRGERPRAAELARGPGNLAKALGIDSLALDGTAALGGGELTVHAPEPDRERTSRIRSGPRVGVGTARIAAAYPWRFWLDGEASVSAYRPGSAPGTRSRGAAKKSRSSAAER